MYYEFYIDVFFVVNLLMDFLLLCLTNRLLTGAANPLRAFLGGMLGAAGMCGFWLFAGEIRAGKLILFYVVMAFVMVRAGCGFRTLKRLFAGVCTLTGAACFMGGILHVFPYAARKGIITFFAITMIAYAVLYIGIRLCKYLKGKETLPCEAVVSQNNRQVTLKGLYDTGNCLYDRETGKAVCVMELDSFRKLLGQEQQIALEQFCSMQEISQDTAGARLLEELKPRFLLYTSVGCQRGLLPVVTAESLTVYTGEHKKQVLHPAVGLSKTALSPEGRFQIIISPAIMDS